MKGMNNLNCVTRLRESWKNKDGIFKRLFIICTILTICVLLSFWISSFALITCIAASISFFFMKGGKKIYILIYLVPFYNVLRLEPYSFVLCSIVLAVAIALLGIEFLIELIRKKKKIEYLHTMLFVALIIYIMLPIGPYNIMYNLKLVSTVAILYFVYINRKDLNFKSLVYIWVVALLISCLLSNLRVVSSRLEWILPDFSSNINNSKRFTGLTDDPNYFAIEIALLLSGLTQLYFSDQIGFVFYPLIFILSLIGFLTLSKSYIIAYILYLSLMMFGFLLYRNMHKKCMLKRIIYITVSILLSITLCIPQIKTTIGRFNNGFIEFNIENNINGEINSDLSNSDLSNSTLNAITTGRSEIWSAYLKAIFSSPNKFLFGHGTGASLPLEISAHNFYLEGLFLFGFVGCLLMICIAVYLFIILMRNHRLKFANLLTLLIIALMLFSLNSLISYRMHALVILISYSLGVQSEKNKKNKEEGENDAKSISDNECVQ